MENMTMDPDYLAQVHVVLMKEWLEGQRSYHERVVHRFHFIAFAFRVFTLCLFAVTVTACLLHLFHIVVPHEAVTSAGNNWRSGALLTILVAALPAFLAAFHGISKQGEFERLTERSEAMADHLGRISKRLAATRSDGRCSVTVGNKVVDIARMMLEETLEWRVMYLAHETELT